ncbi:type II toxin-antitoxin system VapB family antitoxin [bacterium]|jgi:Arc/MetJ family transcription regulator|nr:MAG: type II toxin-antitoxin system VapB family antitoxin [bacterium]
MATNLAIDEKLLCEALRIGGLKTKKDTVNEALKEYVLRRRQGEIVELFGGISYAEDYDYKKLRTRA